MFSIEAPITKDRLLAAFSEEQYMSYYLGVPITKKLFKSPLRVDHRETCSFYRSDKTGLRFKDFGNGVNCNFIDIVMVTNNCKYHTALKIIANDFGLTNTPSLAKKPIPLEYKGEVLDNKESCNIGIEVKDFTEKELLWWNNFGVSPELLQKGRVYSVKTVFLNKIPAFFSSDKVPIYGYFFGHEEDKELWKIYFPTKQKYRFLLNTSKLQGLHMLPKTGELLIITKSMKDVLALRGLGYYAIAPQSENSYPKKEHFEALSKRFTNIVFWYDNDRPGLKSMSTLRKMYRAMFYWIPLCDKVKDISDYYKKYGRDKTSLLLKQLEENIKTGKLDYHLLKYDRAQKQGT